jgi:hypothetical protein
VTRPIVLPPLPPLPVPRIWQDIITGLLTDYARAAVQAERERVEAELVQMGRTL